MSTTTSRVAVVTGAGSGMGRGTALAIARDGGIVALVGRRAAPLEAVSRQIAAEGGRSVVVIEDVAAVGAAGRIVEAVHAAAGPVDLLVHAAGSSSSVQNARWVGEDEWREVIDVNLTAVHLLTQALLEDLLRRGDGTVITISSLAAITPNLLGGAAYGAAKAGVRNYMTFLHTTFRNDGLRAVTVLPGEADTPILDSRARPPAPEERMNMLRPEDVAEAIRLVATLPGRAVVQELIIAPTRQRDTSIDLEISRNTGAPEGVADRKDSE
ncbi:SDR family oxidoreductase [Curtobacterium sp. VKM Ac-2887]|uniref:SDR family oxidoreductase n=1 Tax=Curtobacterium sp. VKM Ac-2887 TaxID=2783819 RepID=UPI00188CE757|nr:SDR family NAD(P)-dependent oxidoreductase [Curtobacterium sp. VKM Ac-2887]MBF4588277.1 SDR family NAD(P)-dependent oxidoreductase [Curtobacterium sp. VKM Ac-2887]